MYSVLWKKHNRTMPRAGFTLIEAAIALGVMALLLGAIWVAAGAVWSNYQTFRLNQQILSIVENVRNHYEPMGRRGACPANGGLPFYLPQCNNAIVSTDLIAASLIPVEMLGPAGCVANDTCNEINHGLRRRTNPGSLVLRSDASGNILRMFLFELPKRICVKLLTQLPVLTPEARIRAIAIGAITANIDTSPAGFSTPIVEGANTHTRIDVPTASSWCATESNDVEIRFQIGQ